MCMCDKDVYQCERDIIKLPRGFERIANYLCLAHGQGVTIATVMCTTNERAVLLRGRRFDLRRPYKLHKSHRARQYYTTIRVCVHSFISCMCFCMRKHILVTVCYANTNSCVSSIFGRTDELLTILLLVLLDVFVGICCIQCMPYGIECHCSAIVSACSVLVALVGVTNLSIWRTTKNGMRLSRTASAFPFEICISQPPSLFESPYYIHIQCCSFNVPSFAGASIYVFRFLFLFNLKKKHPKKIE